MMLAPRLHSHQLARTLHRHGPRRHWQIVRARTFPVPDRRCWVLALHGLSYASFDQRRWLALVASLPEIWALPDRATRSVGLGR